LRHSVNPARAAAVDNNNINIDYKIDKTSCAYPIGGPQGVSVKIERRLLRHSVNRAAVDNIIIIDNQVEKPPAHTLSKGRGDECNECNDFIQREPCRAATVTTSIDYEVEKTSCANPIGGPYGVSVKNVKNDRRLLTQCEPRTGGGCGQDQHHRLRGGETSRAYPV
jgi:hypothetical protein